MTPYFSVIIPCLNEENYLPHLLNNLNSQTFTDFEVIVVDGNSTDKTPKIVTGFPAKYPLRLQSTTTRGVSFQRNLGAKIAKGKVFIFFDADTQIPQNYLNKIHQAFEKKRPHFLTTYIKVNSRTPSEKIFASLSNFGVEAGKIFQIPLSFGAMQAVKSGAFKDIGGYDEATKFGEDSQLFQELSKYNYKFLILPSPCYTFSLRRFRSEGLFNSFIQSLQLNFNILLKGHHATPDHIYEMGGHKYHLKKVSPNHYSQIFNPVFSKIKKSSPQQNHQLRDIFNRLFSSK